LAQIANLRQRWGFGVKIFDLVISFPEQDIAFDKNTINLC